MCDISALLVDLRAYLEVFLGTHLPNVHENWWRDGVWNVLTERQRGVLDRKGNYNLSALDLAALLRVLDQNWYRISQQLNVSREDRHYLKEMISIRNKWAHPDGLDVSEEDMYRDLDTIQRFAVFIDADEKFVEKIKEEKSKILRAAPEKEREMETSAKEIITERLNFQLERLLF